MQRGQKRANGIDDEPIPDPNEDPPTTTSHIYCNSLDNDDPNGLSPLSSPKRKRARHEGNPSGTSSSPPRLFTEEEELANSLVMLSSARLQPISEENPPNMFECKTCKKVFPSHQALGGHRASHKKVKGCYAARLQIESFDAENAPMVENCNQVGSLWENKSLAIVPLAEKLSSPLIKNKSQFHECSVCERRFATGQALGGHMRCHWNKLKTDMNGATATRNNRLDYIIDLNKPAPMEDIAEIPLLVDVPTTLYLLPGLNVENETKELENAVNENFEDEAQSRLAELDKLSHLKDFNDGEESSTWLRIGIGPD